MSHAYKVFAILFCFIEITWAQSPKVVQEINSLNLLRETLVSGVAPPISDKTFKAACGPVGKMAKSMGHKNGWIVRQASHKYRNPQNKTSKIEQEAIEIFQRDKSKSSFWQKTLKGSYYFRRINVQSNCLLCHGSKASRPNFIKIKYPMDKAFDFKVGALRGVYSVFIPNPKHK